MDWIRKTIIETLSLSYQWYLLALSQFSLVFFLGSHFHSQRHQSSLEAVMEGRWCFNWFPHQFRSISEFIFRMLFLSLSAVSFLHRFSSPPTLSFLRTTWKEVIMLLNWCYKSANEWLIFLYSVWIFTLNLFFLN